MHPDIRFVCDLARDAGRAIMTIYSGDHGVEYKDDRSPLTAADRAAHAVIVQGLQRHTPEIPVLSEEGKDIPFEERCNWRRFWLVDPLDGTKEFIKRNGEFTVNIALIEDGRPIAGVVYVPAQDVLYWGVVGEGAWKQVGTAAIARIGVRRPDSERGLTVVMSRSHPSPELADFLKTIKVAEALEIGSSLKLCVVAEGKADIYPRLGPTMEWDTAAGQAVVEAAGGKVTSTLGDKLLYNKKILLNPYFVVVGKAHAVF